MEIDGMLMDFEIKTSQKNYKSVEINTGTGHNQSLSSLVKFENTKIILNRECLNVKEEQ